MSNEKIGVVTRAREESDNKLEDIQFREYERAIQDAITREFNQLKIATDKHSKRQQKQLSGQIETTEECRDEEYEQGVRIKANPWTITLISFALLIACCITASCVGIILNYNEIEQSLQSAIQTFIIYLTSFVGSVCPTPFITPPNLI